MRHSLPLLALPLLASLAGCGPDYYCSDFDDATGRAVAFCDDPRQSPVCNLPGEEARFEEGTRGTELTGAEYATCDEAREVVCPFGTVEPPFCITEPEL